MTMAISSPQGNKLPVACNDVNVFIQINQT